MNFSELKQIRDSRKRVSLAEGIFAKYKARVAHAKEMSTPDKDIVDGIKSHPIYKNKFHGNAKIHSTGWARASRQDDDRTEDGNKHHFMFNENESCSPGLDVHKDKVTGLHHVKVSSWVHTPEDKHYFPSGDGVHKDLHKAIDHAIANHNKDVDKKKSEYEHPFKEKKISPFANKKA